MYSSRRMGTARWGVDSGETTEQGAIRELKEETGLEVDEG